MIHLHSSGSACEIGLDHGTRCSRAVRAAYEACVRLEGIDDLQITNGLRRAEDSLQTSFPEILDEIYGIAAGSGMSRREILTFNFIDVVVGEACRMSGCSTIGFVDSDVGALLGKTADWNVPGPDEYAMWQRYRPAKGEGYSFIHYGCAGAVWTEGGLNEVGLAMVLNGLPASGAPTSSIPWLPLPRATLQYCHSVQAALEFLERYDIMHWGFNLMLADASGELASIEVVPGAQAVQHPRDGYLIHTNHCVVPDTSSRPLHRAILQAYGAWELWENSIARYKTLQRIAPAAPRTAEGMQDLLRDRSAPGAISQSGEQGMRTVYAMIVAPAQGKMWGAEGFPPDVPFVEYRI